MNSSKRYSPEVRERAVRMVFEHQGEHESQWAAIAERACAESRLVIDVAREETDLGEDELRGLLDPAGLIRGGQFFDEGNRHKIQVFGVEAVF